MAKAYLIEWMADGKHFEAYVDEESIIRHRSKYFGSMLQIIENEEKYTEYLLRNISYFDENVGKKLMGQVPSNFLEIQARMGNSFAMLLLARIKYVEGDFQGCDEATGLVKPHQEKLSLKAKAIFNRIRADLHWKRGYYLGAFKRYEEYIVLRQQSDKDYKIETEPEIAGFYNKVKFLADGLNPFVSAKHRLHERIRKLEGGGFEQRYQDSIEKPFNGIKGLNKKFHDSANKGEVMTEGELDELHLKFSEIKPSFEKIEGDVAKAEQDAKESLERKREEAKAEEEARKGAEIIPAPARNEKFDEIIATLTPEDIGPLLPAINPYSPITLGRGSWIGIRFDETGFFDEKGAATDEGQSFFLYLFAKKYKEFFDDGLASFNRKDYRGAREQFAQAYGIFGLKHKLKDWKFGMDIGFYNMAKEEAKKKADWLCRDKAKEMEDNEKKAYCLIMIGLSVSIAEIEDGGFLEGNHKTSVRRGMCALEVSKTISEDTQEVKELKKSARETAFFYCYPKKARDICAKWAKDIKSIDQDGFWYLYKFRLADDGMTRTEQGNRLGKKALGELSLDADLLSEEAESNQEKETEQDEVSILINKLKEGNVEERREAALDLGKQALKKEIPDDAVSALADALKDTDEGVRMNAGGALGKQAGKKELPDDAVSALAGALKDTDEGVRMNAAWALRNQAEKKELPDDAVSALADALADEDKYVRRRAAFALERQAGKKELPDDAVSALADALADEDEEVRQNAAMALGKQAGKKGLDIEGLEKILKKAGAKLTDEEIQRVKDFFGVGGEEKEEAKVEEKETAQDEISTLINKLKEGNVDERIEAVEALEDQAEEKELPDDAVSALAGSLKDTNLDVRASATLALEEQALKKRLGTKKIERLIYRPDYEQFTDEEIQQVKEAFGIGGEEKEAGAEEDKLVAKDAPTDSGEGSKPLAKGQTLKFGDTELFVEDVEEEQIGEEGK